MVAEWRNKTENPVELGRPSTAPNSSIKLISGFRVRQPLLAKEPLCGTQPTNISLVIAVFGFPSYFVVLPFFQGKKRRSVIERS